MYGVRGAKIRRGSRLADRDPTPNGEQTANMLRFCTWFFERAQLQYKDIRDVEHSIEVTAETLYEAIATALAALRPRTTG
jgi:hypothetical protein